MMCSECKPMAPRTLDQLDNRLRNIALAGSAVSIHACLKCGGIEYMTTDTMIEKLPPKPNYQWSLDHDKLRSEIKSLVEFPGYFLVMIAIGILTIWFLNL